MVSFRKLNVEKFFGSLMNGDLNTATSLLHPQVVITQPEELPYGRVYRGLQGFNECMSFFSGRLELSIQRVEALDAEPYGIGYISFTFRSPITGETVETTSLDLVQFADDRKIIGITPYHFRPHAVMELDQRGQVGP